MKSNNNLIKYDESFLEQVFFNLHNYEVLEIDTCGMYNLSNKEKEVLSKLKKLYSKINLLKDYRTVSLERISNQEVLEKANCFLINTFPKREREILELDNLICFGDFYIEEVGLEYSLRKPNEIIFNKILIPDIGSDYMSSALVHEKMHALTFKNIDLKYLFSHNIELLPILLEKMLLCDLDNYYSKILNQLVRLNDTKQCFMHLDFMQYLRNNPNKTALDECVYNYFNVRNHEYLLGELYTDLLIEYYLADKDRFINKLNQVLDNKLSIDSFLESYDINLLNKNLIPIVKRQTDKCKRISIFP